MQTAKVFKSGGSMAIRIPKSINLDGIKEFIITQKTKKEITLTPVLKQNEWSELLNTLNKLKQSKEELKLPERLAPKERNFGFE
ncbi:antitoxin [Campylobacter mucosalis]|uniref:antitoxin n=1 Tax=Campylobacter mucosalis TaxID=202 RepID=UPI00147048B1|nr:AbrB/MazE/SpoVT family DNA-binding domain-containing protein [Campylobacter mucosalis]